MNRDAQSITGRIVRTAAVLGFLGVSFGAFGAHALEARLQAADRTATWETAVLYHLVHVVALLALGALGSVPSRRLIAWFWSVGVVVFSGSLYVLCLTGATWLGAITPLGGVSWLIGWGWLAAAPFRSAGGEG